MQSLACGDKNERCDGSKHGSKHVVSTGTIVESSGVSQLTPAPDSSRIMAQQTTQDRRLPTHKCILHTVLVCYDVAVYAAIVLVHAVIAAWGEMEWV